MSNDHYLDLDLNDQDSQGNTMDNPMLALIETLAVTWFTLEYLLRSKPKTKPLEDLTLSTYFRFAGAPEKWKFLKDGMNIIDVVTPFPCH